MSEQVNLQGLADIVAEQSAQLSAQRFLIQCLWSILREKGLTTHNGGDDSVLAVARLALGKSGLQPNEPVLQLIEAMAAKEPVPAQILTFPK